jgi:hypothetical protein
MVTLVKSALAKFLVSKSPQILKKVAEPDKTRFIAGTRPCHHQCGGRGIRAKVAKILPHDSGHLRVNDIIAIAKGANGLALPPGAPSGVVALGLRSAELLG